MKVPEGLDIAEVVLQTYRKRFLTELSKGPRAPVNLKEVALSKSVNTIYHLQVLAAYGLVRGGDLTRFKRIRPYTLTDKGVAIVQQFGL